jgi:hypothetical protein
MFNLNSKLIDSAIDKAAEKVSEWIKEKYDSDLVGLIADRLISKIAEDEKWRNVLLESMVGAIFNQFKEKNSPDNAD